MTSRKDVRFNDLGLEAVIQLSKVEVHLTNTIVKRCYVYAIFEVLKELSKGLHSLAILLAAIEVQVSQLRSSNSRVLDNILH